MADSVLRVLLKGDASGLNSSLKTASSKLESFGSKVKSVGSSLSRLSLPLGIAGGAAIKMASDFQESLNKVDVAFKGSSNQVKKFAKTTLDSFGIAEGTALDMAALFGDMSTSMGLNTQEAANMSTALVGLAGDLASFKNMNIEQVTTALNGVFTGETESLKRLGIVMTEANLQQFAMSEGIKKNIKDFSQAEKVQLRYRYVMAMTTNAQGDFSRTSDGAANQMRIFQETLKELGATFGETMLPTFTEAVKKVNELLKEFKELDPETKKNIISFGALLLALGPVLKIAGSVISAFGKMKGAIKSLGTATGGALGSAITGIGALLFAFDQLTDKVASNLSLWEKLKITFQSGGFGGGAGMAQALVNMGTQSFIKGQQNNQDQQLSGMDLLSYGQTGEQRTTPSGNVVDALDEELAALEKNIEGWDEFATRFNYDLKESEANIEYFANSVSTIIDGIGDKGGELAEQMSIDFGMIGASIGQALATAVVNGDNLIQTLAASILSALGSLLVQIGKAAVLASEAIKKFAIPSLGLAAGIAAIAFGTLLQGISTKVQSGSFAAFANGGIVSSPTLGLVGEYAGARSNPEVIAPLDKLKSLIGDRGTGNVNVTGAFRVQGQDLVVALQRAENLRTRKG